jgi:cell division protein FtsQ
VSEVDVSNPEDVKALVASGGSDILVHFGEQDFLQRYREFEQHLPEWKQQYPKLASADMRYEGQIVLEMQKGEGVPVAGDSAGSAAAAGADAKTNATTTATADSSSFSFDKLNVRNDIQNSNSNGNSKDRSRSFPIDALRVRMTTKKATAKAKPPIGKAATAKAAAAKTPAKANASAAREPKAFWVKGAGPRTARVAGAGGGTTP